MEVSLIYYNQGKFKDQIENEVDGKSVGIE